MEKKVEQGPPVDDNAHNFTVATIVPEHFCGKECIRLAFRHCFQTAVITVVLLPACCWFCQHDCDVGIITT